MTMKPPIGFFNSHTTAAILWPRNWDISRNSKKEIKKLLAKLDTTLNESKSTLIFGFHSG